MKLNSNEQVSYKKNFLDVIPTLPTGKYHIADFFGTEPSVPRVARQFYEDVVTKRFPNVRLFNQRSSDGYIIF